MPIIDAHQHIWDPSVAPYPWLAAEPDVLNRAIAIDELLPELAEAGVGRVVQVQSDDHPDDTRLMRECAATHPEVAAIVGYAPLADPGATAATAESWRADSLMVGVRNLIHNLPDADWLLRPEVDESLGVLEREGLSFDVVAVLPRHAEIIPTISWRHPGLRMVIDHLAKPPIGGSAADAGHWRSLMRAAAENPNVFAKVSGLYSSVGSPADWTTEAIRPFFDDALEIFGAERLMYGGDWPISLVAGGYTAVWRGLAPLFSPLSAEERGFVLSETAASFYRIDPARR